MFYAELLKLKRSSLWAIAVVLPLLAVITGSANFYGNQHVLTNGFDSLTSQITIFYGFLFFSIGIACLASAAWRMEHQGTNWNLLLATVDSPLRLVLAKITSITVGVFAMQATLVILTYCSGALIVGATGNISATFFWVVMFSVITALPLISLQSLLSMVIKSFAAPVALCLLGCIAGIAISTKEALHPFVYLLPQAINLQSLQIGSTAVRGTGGFELATLGPLVLSSMCLTAVFIGLTVLAIRIYTLK